MALPSKKPYSTTFSFLDNFKVHHLQLHRAWVLRQLRRVENIRLQGSRGRNGPQATVPSLRVRQQWMHSISSFCTQSPFLSSYSCLSSPCKTWQCLIPLQKAPGIFFRENLTLPIASSAILMSTLTRRKINGWWSKRTKIASNTRNDSRQNSTSKT